jgi:Domain of unknown function (DUF5060)
LLAATVLAAAPAVAVPLRFDFEEATTDWVPCSVDPGTKSVAVTTTTAARGRQALEVAGTFPGSIGATYYPWQDWRPYGLLRFQVYVPQGAPTDLDVYVYLKDRQYLWFQTAPFRAADTGERVIPLRKDAWNEATVDISPDSQAWEPGGHLKAWDGALYYPREFGIRFFSKAAWQGSLLIDDVRLIETRETQPPQVSGDAPALKVRRNAGKLPCYQKLELTFSLERDYSNPYDPKVVDVQAHFRVPSGQTVDVPGFYYQDYTRLQDAKGNEKLAPVGESCWKVRYSPWETGTYEYFVTVKDDRGELRSATEKLEATAPADPRGRVRVSTADPRYFEFENGEFYYPFGINMRDGGDQAAAQRGTYAFDEFFPAFQRAGLSFVRTWMCAWWAGIEWTDKYDSRFDGIGRYSMYNAWRLDHALDLAERNDQFIELTLGSHGQLRRDKFDAEWYYNPYAAANGGPVVEPSLFFLSPIAKDYVRQRYRYIVARWGYSQHIMSWDLWNEIDLIDAYAQLMGDVAAWHREMTGYLRDIDPGKHLITTHFCLHGSWDGGRSLWSLPNIDYIQADAYWPKKHIGDDMSQGYGSRADIAKPYMCIEYGPQTVQIGGLTPAQIEGYYRIGLWTGLVLPMAAPPKFWYNDRWQSDAYARFDEAAARFAGGEDRRGQQWRWMNCDPEVNARAPRSSPPGLYSQVMTSPKAVYFYTFDLGRMMSGEAARQLAPIQNVSLSVWGIPDGTYDAECWDPYAGMVIGKSEVTAAKGAAQIPLPAFLQDVACKMRLR